jgi:hypothetical protein
MKAIMSKPLEGGIRNAEGGSGKKKAEAGMLKIEKRLQLDISGHFVSIPPSAFSLPPSTLPIPNSKLIVPTSASLPA